MKHLLITLGLLIASPSFADEKYYILVLKTPSYDISISAWESRIDCVDMLVTMEPFIDETATLICREGL